MAAASPEPISGDADLATTAQRLIDSAQQLLNTPAPESPGGCIDRALFKRVQLLKDLRLELDRMSAALKVEEDEGQEALTDQYRQVGTIITEYDGYYGTLRRSLRARKANDAVTGEDVAAALIADGLEHFVTPPSYNATQMSAYINRLDEAGQEIPKHLAEVLEAYEDWKVGFTKRRPTAAALRLAGAPSSVLDGASKD